MSKPGKTHVANIFGIELYLDDDILKMIHDEFPDDHEKYKKCLGDIINTMIPMCRLKSLREKE